ALRRRRGEAVPGGEARRRPDRTLSPGEGGGNLTGVQGAHRAGEGGPRGLQGRRGEVLQRHPARRRTGGGVRPAARGRAQQACRAHLQEVRARFNEVKEACRDDAGKFCTNVPPGRGRVAVCLHEHLADLSDTCRVSLTKSRAGAGLRSLEVPGIGGPRGHPDSTLLEAGSSPSSGECSFTGAAFRARSRRFSSSTPSENAIAKYT